MRYRRFGWRLVGLGLVFCGGTLAARQGAAPGQAPPGSTAPGPAAGRGAGPQTVPPGGFFFIQMSDPQFGFSNNDIDFVQDTANAEFAVATINRLKPAFVVITGDLINKPGDPAQLAEYKRITAKISPSIPVYAMPGNHDIENAPTPASVAAYRAALGKDYYTFRYGSLVGIVLDSTLIHTPTNVEAEYAAQDAWLRDSLAKARTTGVVHVVIFQHHPWFLEKADEADQYFNVPRVRRDPLLALFRQHGVKYLVSGHLHRSTEATDAGVTTIVTGPVGRPLGGSSGLRVFVVTDTEITSRYYGFGEMPYQIGPAATGPGRGNMKPPRAR